MTVTVLVCGPTLRAIAQPVQKWTGLTSERKFNEPGVGEFLAPVTTELLTALATPDSRITVIQDGEIFASGPVEKPGGQAWSAEDGDGNVRVAFATNEALLGERIVYPNPAQAFAAQTAEAYTAVGVNAETLLRTLVNTQAGPGALAGRAIPGLVLGAVSGVGVPVDLTARMDPLTDVLRAVAAAGGGLGWRLRQVGQQLVFEVWAPVDRSGYVRFGRGLANLREFTTDPESPTCTAALVGGAGEGVLRTVVERVNTTAVAAGHRRVERFVNQGEGTLGELNAAGDFALFDGAFRIGLSAVAIDPPAGVNPGDLVAVELAPGYAITDRVTSITLTADPDRGEVITLAVGAGPTSDPTTIEIIRAMNARLGRLERG